MFDRLRATLLMRCTGRNRSLCTEGLPYSVRVLRESERGRGFLISRNTTHDSKKERFLRDFKGEITMQLAVAQFLCSTRHRDFSHV